MSTKTIDLTPTWHEVLPALIALVENPVTRKTGIAELKRMAGAADRYISLVKADRIKAEVK